MDGIICPDNTIVDIYIINDNMCVVNPYYKGVNNLANRDVKLAAAGAGVRMWQIADELGMLDSNFSRKLRHELAQGEKERIFKIIEKLSGGGAVADTN